MTISITRHHISHIDALGPQIGDRIDLEVKNEPHQVSNDGYYRITTDQPCLVRCGNASLDNAEGGELWEKGTVEIRILSAGDKIAVGSYPALSLPRPILMDPTGEAYGPDVARLTVSTDTGNGTLYWYVSITADKPTAAALKTGDGATAFGNRTVDTLGVQLVEVSELAPKTAYFVHFLHRNEVGRESIIATSGSFITDAAEPATDPDVLSINANGYMVEHADPAKIDGKTVLVLDSVGFDGNGEAVTHRIVRPITARLRQPYPNQAQNDPSKVVPSDYIYATDVIVRDDPVANNSTETSPKPIANWIMPDRLLVGRAIDWEVVAFHRNARLGRQVACVQVRATDGETTTPWQTISEVSISNLCEDANPIEVYAGNLDVSALDDGLITLQGRVLPWIGDAESIFDSADQSATREFSARYFLKNETRADNPPLAYVSSTGNDSTGIWSSTPSTAEATPFLTIGGAMAAMNHTTRGAPVTGGIMDGCRIRVVDTVNFGTTGTARPQNIAGVIVERAPNTDRAAATIIWDATFRARLGVGSLAAPLTEGAITFYDVSLNRTGAFTISGDSGTYLQVRLWNCVLTNNSTASIRNLSHFYFYGVTIAGTAPSLNVASNLEYRIFRGLTADVNGATEAALLIGSNITRSSGTTFADPSRGAIIYNNKFLNPSATNGAGRFNGNVAHTNFGPLALVQNLIETTHTTSSTIGFAIAADAQLGNLIHAVVMHNTLTGYGSVGRSNFYYDEHPTVPRFHRLIREAGNIYSQLNTKGDVFMQDGTRLGQRAYSHGVGVEGNFSMFRPNSNTPFSENQVYPGIYSSIATSPSRRSDPLFVDYQGTAGDGAATIGMGGGDYRLQEESPARGRVSSAGLAFDLAGNARGMITAAGAFVPVNGDTETEMPDISSGEGGEYVPEGADAGEGAPLTGASPLSLTIAGVVVDLENVATSGQHVDGSWWVVPNHVDGIGLAGYTMHIDELQDRWLGGCMLDPGRPLRPNIKKHGFDWRTTGNKTDPSGPKTGSGPGVTYDPAYALAVPRRIKPYANGPTTLWIYRGIDNDQLTSGGGASGCAQMVQITVYASAPPTNTIKPPGLYVAGGKPVRNRSEINFAALPSYPLPSGVTQPNWEDDFGFHRHATWRWGNRNEAAAISPRRTQEQYPADQSVMTNMVAVGACFDIAKRQELIERLVRDGLETHAGTSFAPDNSAYFSGGGFGPGGRIPRFLAGIALNDSAMLMMPPEIDPGALAAHNIPFFAEDCSTCWSVRKIGDVADAGGTYQALFGDMATTAYLSGNYILSHTSRDKDLLRDSYRLATQTFTVESVSGNQIVVTSASNDLSKLQPGNPTNQGYHRALRIMSGINAGKFVFLSQSVDGVDISWNAATRTITVETAATWAQPVEMPSSGDIIEYRVAAVYDQIVSAALLGSAMAVVLMGKVPEYAISEDIRAMFAYVRDFKDRGGKYLDKKNQNPPFNRSSNTFSTTFGPAEAVRMQGKWLALLWPTAEALWPDHSGPLA